MTDLGLIFFALIFCGVSMHVAAAKIAKAIREGKASDA